MAIPQLDSCCCGCSLKTGSKIIGWISLIANIATLIIFGLGLAAIYYIEEHPTENPTPETKEILAHLPLLKTVAVVMIIVHLIGCGLAFILLLGVYQNKAKLVFVWIMIALTIALIEQIVNLVQMFVLFQSTNVFNILGFLVDLYFILVVYSFYRDIRTVSSYP